MYGAIIGDFAGSIYEYPEFIDTRKQKINYERRQLILKKESIISKNSFYSDDTILTIAILDSVINEKDYATTLRQYARDFEHYKATDKMYFTTSFSPNFIKWCKEEIKGDSIGNGSAMRVSPIGQLYPNEQRVLQETEKATICSHNSEEALKGAESIALAIHLLKKGYDKNKVIKYICQTFDYDIEYDLSTLQKTNTFTSNCSTTVKEALFCFKISNNFDQAIKYAVSIGGDTDTTAAITGSLAETIYPIKQEYIEYVDNNIPSNFVKLLKEAKCQSIK